MTGPLHGRDNKYDGHLTIKDGQGLTQAIADELGLNNTQCNKLGSVWTKILDVAKEEGNLETGSSKYTGKDDVTGKWQIFKDGEVFKFTNDAWNKIVDLVNIKLGEDTCAKLESNDPIAGKEPVLTEQTAVGAEETSGNQTNEEIPEINSIKPLLEKAAANPGLQVSEENHFDGHGVFLNISRNVKIDENSNINIIYHKDGTADMCINNGETKTSYKILSDGEVLYRNDDGWSDIDAAADILSQVKELFGEQPIGKFLYQAVKGVGSYGATDQINKITEDNVVSVIEDFNTLAASDNESITTFLRGERALGRKTVVKPAYILLNKAESLGLSETESYKKLKGSVDLYAGGNSIDLPGQCKNIDKYMLELIAEIKNKEAK